MGATSVPSWRSRFETAERAAHLMVATVVVASGAWIVVSSVSTRTWSDPDARPAPAESATLRRVVHRLEDTGVKLRAPVRRSLNQLVDVWAGRPDLRRLFTDGDGLPNLQGLFEWVRGTPDASAIELLDDRGNLDELAGRMSILPPDGDLVAPLTWTLRNRARPVHAATPIIGRLSEVWDSRPEVRAQFVAGGRVQVRALLFWAVNLPRTDPSFHRLNEVAPDLAQLLEELQGR